MNIYLAPMEGLTGYIFRNAFDKHFGRKKIDKYFIPFISPNQSNGYTARERADIAVENNTGLRVVAQIMANNPKYFLKSVEMLKEMGYDEINLNTGCPSGTVVSKFKGAGFLAQPEALDNFLAEVTASEQMQGIKFSIKTRLGMEKSDEFKYILDIYNKYELNELIIHPRVRSDFYNNTPDLEAFEYALQNSANPVCYNGDIFTRQDYIRFSERFSCEKYDKLCAVMLGRGFVGNPVLIDIMTADNPYEYTYNKNDCKKRVKAFHDDVFNGYLTVLSGDKNAMHKMKEMWIYMQRAFTGGEKAFKHIKKAQRICDYEAAVTEFFVNADLK